MSAKNPTPLLPCPWCGSEKVEADYDDGDLQCGVRPQMSIRCMACMASGPGLDEETPTAIAAWNKGPYADRFEIHAKALFDHAKELQDKAAEHLRKADELLKAAATQVKKAKQ